MKNMLLTLKTVVFGYPRKNIKLLSIPLILSLSFNTFAQDIDTEKSTSSVSSSSSLKSPQPLTAQAWLKKLKTALTQANYQAGIVTMKAGKTTSYNWLHGVVSNTTSDTDIDSSELQITEVESITPAMGVGINILRHDQTVMFIEPNKDAYSVKSNTIRKFIPPVLYQDTNVLSKSYTFNKVSETEIGGRDAQLIRIESINNTAYDYLVWIDVQSALPLRMAFVNEKNEVIEQVVMTHLSLFNGPNDDIIKLSTHQLAPTVALTETNFQETNNWNMSWLPNGFELIKSNRHHLPNTNEVSDYYLYSDGLVEFSIYVQRQLDSFTSPLILQEGAMSFVMVRSDGFDVTVVGTIPTKTAHKIAQSIKST
jgi:sigma-E factor negative regulatory protein RseB